MWTCHVQRAAWAKEDAEKEADKSARRAAREAKAEIGAEKIKGSVADERLADETIGDEVRKLVWYGFDEGDGPMEYDNSCVGAGEHVGDLNYGFKDGWTQGRASIGEWNWELGDDGENRRGDMKTVGFACTNCSGLSAEAFFKSFKKGDDFGLSVDGEQYHGIVAMMPTCGNSVHLDIRFNQDAGYPEKGLSGNVQVIRHASNVDPDTARACKFYEDLQPAEATFWAAGNVCAHCGVLRADHNVCGTFV